MTLTRLVGVVSALILLLTSPNAAAQCGDIGVWLQVLGSGGPFGVGRASAGYLIWIDGVSRIMVDAGGGTFARFHEAGARTADLELLALSHFHPDHSSEVPALLWPRAGTVRIAGPSGSDGYPSVDEFLYGLFKAPDAVFRVIGPRIEFDVRTVDASARQPLEVFRAGNVTVRGIGVPHGDVPTIGYRVDVGDASIGFSSDQVGTNPAFTSLVAEADVLVVHFAASETASEDPRAITAALHAKPSVWGAMAADARVGAVVLSHLSEPEPSHPAYSSHTDSDFEGSVAHLRSRYDGPLTVAEDLMCVPIE